MRPALKSLLNVAFVAFGLEPIARAICDTENVSPGFRSSVDRIFSRTSIILMIAIHLVIIDFLVLLLIGDKIHGVPSSVPTPLEWRKQSTIVGRRRLGHQMYEMEYLVSRTRKNNCIVT